MKMKAIVTCGLFFGDEGKGSAVDFLVREQDAKMVVRYNSGHQCGHNVHTSSGKHHCFSQFGSGTLAGAATYIGPNVIIEPLAMAKEYEHLTELGADPTIYIDNFCLVTTPYHKYLNQIRELNRDNRHGSCGVGVGTTREYYLKYGSDSIFHHEIDNVSWYDVLTDKLQLIKQRVLHEIELYPAKNYDRWAHLAELVYNLTPKKVAVDMREAYDLIGPLEGDGRLPFKSDVTIFESGQGILLDQRYGFYPYVTFSDTTSKHALELIPDGVETEVLGVTRPYLTRHGAGPLPSKAEFDHAPDDNELNEWQGNFRYGYLDKNLLQYALSCDPIIDGLFVTHCDEYPKVTANHSVELKPQINLERQNAYTQLLSKPSSLKWNYNYIEEDKDPLEYLRSNYNVKYESYGNTHEEKVVLETTHA